MAPLGITLDTDRAERLQVRWDGKKLTIKSL
jgi:hypothetical protein